MNIFENSYLLKEFKVDDSAIKDLNLIDMTNDEIQKSSEIIIYCDLIFTSIENLLNKMINVNNGSAEIKKNDDTLQYRQKGLLSDISKDDIEAIKKIIIKYFTHNTLFTDKYNIYMNIDYLHKDANDKVIFEYYITASINLNKIL